MDLFVFVFVVFAIHAWVKRKFIKWALRQNDSSLLKLYFYQPCQYKFGRFIYYVVIIVSVPVAASIGQIVSPGYSMDANPPIRGVLTKAYTGNRGPGHIKVKKANNEHVHIKVKIRGMREIWKSHIGKNVEVYWAYSEAVPLGKIGSLIADSRIALKVIAEGNVVIHYGQDFHERVAQFHKWLLLYPWLVSVAIMAIWPLLLYLVKNHNETDT